MAVHKFTVHYKFNGQSPPHTHALQQAKTPSLTVGTYMYTCAYVFVTIVHLYTVLFASNLMSICTFAYCVLFKRPNLCTYSLKALTS
jgi:hypothetical protein